MNRSYFDGKLLGWLGTAIIAWLITVISFGILYPWAIVMMLQWKARHTVIDGQRMVFDGTAMGLFGNWIKWLVLMIITLGIYGLWVHIAMEEWKTKHTHFA